MTYWRCGKGKIMKKLVSLHISCLMICSLFQIKDGYAGQDDTQYNIVNIPKDLVKDSNAIVRMNSILFEAKDHKRARMRVKRAVTIFNRESRHLGELVIPYDKFSEIEELEGVIYSREGKKLRELKDNEVKDFSNINYYSLYEDTRVRTATLYYDQYPYTVEFLYEISYDGYLSWPTWFAQEDENAVEFSRFEVTLPINQDLRFWCNRDSTKPDIRYEEKKKHYTWEVSCLPKLPSDVVYDIEDVTIIVKIAPSSFEIGGSSGSMNTWREFGEWYYQLIQGRNNLPLSVKKEVQSLMDSTDTPYEKIKKIYQYMQSRTRYVSIQLGIGGWQPFDAKYVHENGYGDCKALTNYMGALLEAANIRAYPVLIRNGHCRYPMIVKFPSIQFNHMIMCVPVGRDTVWLECTNNSIPVGHIGAGNEDRSALMITPEGGIVVQTPSSLAEINIQKREATVALFSNGDAEVRTKTLFSGDQQDYIRNTLYEASSEDKEKWLLSILKLPKVEIKYFNICGISEHALELSLSIDFSTSRFLSSSGSRLFFQPNLMERRTTVPADVALPLSPLRLSYAYCDIDSIYYRIPHGYKPEALPQKVNMRTQFGFFSSQSIALGDTVVVFQRTLNIQQKNIPLESYKDYRNFIAEVVRADRAQAVLVKKDMQ
jgi:transglutaminase-like putative cysteine protease